MLGKRLYVWECEEVIPTSSSSRTEVICVYPVTNLLVPPDDAATFLCVVTNGNNTKHPQSANKTKHPQRPFTHTVGQQ
eukprot:1179179-Prorocentrum_minimum.AAC.5